MSPEEIEALDSYREELEDKPSRAQALRRIAKDRLKV